MCMLLNFNYPWSQSLVLSILLYGYESWTMTVYLRKRIQAFENKCYRRVLGISYKEHKTNENVWQQVIIIAVRQELLLPSVANYHDSVVSVVAISCQKSNCREQLMIFVAQEDCVNHGAGNIKEWTCDTLS